LNINQLIGNFEQIAINLLNIAKIYKIEKKNETLRRTRDLLLPRLITGEVDVSELDITIPEEAVV
jgi:type I restriction enzyme S subunit